MADGRSTYGLGLFLAGLGAGALLGVLFAPKSGRETREDIASTAREKSEYLRQRSREVSDRVSGYADRGKEYVNKGRAQWEEFVNRGRQFVSDQSDKFSAAVDAGKEAYRQPPAPSSENAGEGPTA